MHIRPPQSPPDVSLRLPLSKSIANRLLLMNYLAGEVPEQLQPGSDDYLLMQKMIFQLGHKKDDSVFDAGDAGTVFRFMAALLANTDGKHLLTGSQRMQQRPCAPLVDALRVLGAEIKYTGRQGFPPLMIEGKRLSGGQVDVDASVSSQFVSALMLVAPEMENGIEIHLKGGVVSPSYIELTAGLMVRRGARVLMNLPVIKVNKGSYRVSETSEEGDWSAAAFWMQMVALMPDSSIHIGGLKPESLQGDRVAVDIFRKLGVDSHFDNDVLILTYSGNPVPFLEYDFNSCPDLLPAVAVACAGLGTGARFTGLSTLHIKESDRIQAVISGLLKLGYRAVSPFAGRLEILRGQNPVKGGVVSAFGDHRIAMAFAMLALKTGSVILDAPSVVAKSYPGFWDDLRKAGFILTGG